MKTLLKFMIVIILLAGISGAAWYFANDLFLKPKQQLEEERLTPPSPPPPPPDPSLPEVEKAMGMLEQNQREEARALLAAIVHTFPGSTRISEVKTRLGELNTDALFSMDPSPHKAEHTVVRGDSLNKIAGQLGSTAELIMRANNMESTLLQIGMRLIVPQYQFAMEIDHDAQTVTLLHEGRFFKEYPASTFRLPGGKPGSPTEMKVTEKLAWHGGERVAFGSKEYLAGTRWIQLSRPGFVIFGDAPEDENATRPATGIGLPPHEMEELHTLATRNMVVTLR